MLTVAASAMTIEGTFPTFLDGFPAQFPGVRLALVEADADKHLQMLEHGDADFAINVVNVVEVDDNRFGTFLLPRFHIAAVMSASLAPGAAETIDIGKVVEHPLLLPNTSYATRHLFDAACRLADVRPLVRLESGSSRTLLALAEAGHGIAIIPSILRLHGDGTARAARHASRRAAADCAGGHLGQAANPAAPRAAIFQSAGRTSTASASPIGR